MGPLALHHGLGGGRAAAAALFQLSPTLDARKDYSLVRPPAVTLAEVEARFGAGQPSVRVHATSAFKRWYHLEVADAPNTFSRDCARVTS